MLVSYFRKDFVSLLSWDNLPLYFRFFLDQNILYSSPWKVWQLYDGIKLFFVTVYRMTQNKIMLRTESNRKAKKCFSCQAFLRRFVKASPLGHSKIKSIVRTSETISKTINATKKMSSKTP